MIDTSIRDNERRFQEAEMDVVFHHNRNDSTVISLTKDELHALAVKGTAYLEEGGYYREH